MKKSKKKKKNSISTYIAHFKLALLNSLTQKICQTPSLYRCINSIYKYGKK